MIRWIKILLNELSVSQNHHAADDALQEHRCATCTTSRERRKKEVSMPNGGEMMCPMCLSVLLIGLLWVVLFILLIAGMIWAIRLAKREGYFYRKARSADRAIAILKER